MNKTKNNWPDIAIIKLFAAISIISLVVIFFKYSKYYSCDNIQINTISNKYQEGEVVAFNCDFLQAGEYIWDFGDGSPVQYGSMVNHIYQSSGRFLLTLRVDNVCFKEEYITINHIKDEREFNLYPVFTIPEIAYIDEPFTVTDRTKDGEKWEWRFGESFGIDAETKTAEYTYRTTGVKQITLVVNGRYEFAGKKTITVLPAPEKEIKPLVILEPEEEEPLPIDTSFAPVSPSLTKVKYEYVAEVLTNEVLSEILMLISEGKKTVNDLIPYTCGDVEIPVRVNELRTRLDKFCAKIKGKKIKIVELEILKNEKTNCVTFIKITYKQSRFGGLFYF